MEAIFDGGAITSDAGALLLGQTDRTIGLVDCFAVGFRDGRRPELIEHRLETLVGQRAFALAWGYEDLVDHDDLHQAPVMALPAGKLADPGQKRDTGCKVPYWVGEWQEPVTEAYPVSRRM